MSLTKQDFNMMNGRFVKTRLDQGLTDERAAAAVRMLTDGSDALRREEARCSAEREARELAADMRRWVERTAEELPDEMALVRLGGDLRPGKALISTAQKAAKCGIDKDTAKRCDRGAGSPRARWTSRRSCALDLPPRVNPAVSASS